MNLVLEIVSKKKSLLTLWKAVQLCLFNLPQCEEFTDNVSFYPCILNVGKLCCLLIGNI